MTETPELHPVPGYDGYFVTRCGQVWSDKSGTLRQKTPVRRRNGRCQVSMRVNGRHVNRLVHTLVALAFLGPPPLGMWVLHDNDKPWDNRLCNLRYGTPLDNKDDSRRNGTLIDLEVKDEVQRLFAEGVSKVEIARRLKLSETSVRGMLGAAPTGVQMSRLSTAVARSKVTEEETRALRDAMAPFAAVCHRFKRLQEMLT